MNFLPAESPTAIFQMFAFCVSDACLIHDWCRIGFCFMLAWCLIDVYLVCARCCMLAACLSLLAECLRSACCKFAASLLRACCVFAACLLRACCVITACLLHAWCVLVCALYLLCVCLLHYLNFPPKLGSTRGPPLPLYAYGSSPSSCLFPNLVEPSCFLVSASTNQSAALA